MESNYEKEMNKRNEKIPYEKDMNKRNEKIPYEKEMNKRNEKIPDPQNCFGGAAINQYPQIVLGGGGREGGTPTLISIQHYNACRNNTKPSKRLPLLILPHLQEWLTRANAKYKSLEEERLWEKQLESKILVARDGSG